jgi:hypothetical protein
VTFIVALIVLVAVMLHDRFVSFEGEEGTTVNLVINGISLKFACALQREVFNTDTFVVALLAFSSEQLPVVMVQLMK